jgi:hypothetical protein
VPWKEGRCISAVASWTDIVRNLAVINDMHREVTERGFAWIILDENDGD